MKNTEFFSTMGAEQLHEVNGGGFAYDVGRVLRFIALSGGGLNPIALTNAITDWHINAIINNT